jgi:nucleotide-binding universal stress UspA family protein
MSSSENAMRRSALDVPSVEADRLYGLPLESFTSERRELVKKLRQRGDKKAADTVASLSKPSIAAWTVNQLARRHRRDVDLLLDASHRLIDAQRTTLTKGLRDPLDRARQTQPRRSAD